MVFTGAIDSQRKAYIAYLARQKILPAVEILKQCNGIQNSRRVHIRKTDRSRLYAQEDLRASCARVTREKLFAVCERYEKRKDIFPPVGLRSGLV